MWVFAPVFRGPQAARQHVGTHRLALGMLAAILVANAVLTLPLVNQVSPAGLTTGTFMVAALATQVPMLAVLYSRLIAPGAMTWRELGLRPMPAGRALWIGVLAGFGGLVITGILEALLAQFGLRSNQLDQFSFVRNDGPAAFALVLVSGVILAPFIEELFFRGFLFGAYRQRQPLWVAYLASGLLFTVLHLEPARMNVAQMLGLGVGIFVLGTLLAWLYQKTGSLFPSIIAHAFNNAVGLVLYYSYGLAPPTA